MRHLTPLALAGMLAGCTGGDDPAPTSGPETHEHVAPSTPPKVLPHEDELKRLEGTWEVVSRVFNGTTQPQPRGGMRLVIRGSAYSQEALGETFEQGSLQVDPTKKPCSLDLSPEVGREKGRTFLCIYELEGDGLLYCLRPSGGFRPTEFTAEPGSNLEIVTLRRVKSR
jgi:uncharacterized protein (TIGR03067 family)